MYDNEHKLSQLQQSRKAREINDHYNNECSSSDLNISEGTKLCSPVLHSFKLLGQTDIRNRQRLTKIIIQSNPNLTPVRQLFLIPKWY